LGVGWRSKKTRTRILSSRLGVVFLFDESELDPDATEMQEQVFRLVEGRPVHRSSPSLRRPTAAAFKDSVAVVKPWISCPICPSVVPCHYKKNWVFGEFYLLACHALIGPKCDCKHANTEEHHQNQPHQTFIVQLETNVG
jgi:hypothetical protein